MKWFHVYCHGLNFASPSSSVSPVHPEIQYEYGTRTQQSCHFYRVRSSCHLVCRVSSSIVLLTQACRVANE